jgi:hypothetical protein
MEGAEGLSPPVGFHLIYDLSEHQQLMNASTRKSFSHGLLCVVHYQILVTETMVLSVLNTRVATPCHKIRTGRAPLYH